MKNPYLFKMASDEFKLAAQALQKRCQLLTLFNPKLMKGMKKEYFSGVVMLAPAYLSGYEVCAFRTPGCTRACLNTAGRGGMVKGGARTMEQVIKKSNIVQKARLWRTKWLFNITKESSSTPEVPPAFGVQLVREISLLVDFCGRFGLTPCVRLNGTSDLRWESMPIGEERNIMRIFPKLQFYDYTKHPLSNRGNRPPNYYLVYSVNESQNSIQRAKAWQDAGFNIAVVFFTKRGKPLPRKWLGQPVIDGDLHDLRFLDPKGVVGLRAKGFAQDDKTGFVHPGNGQTNPPEQMTFEGGLLFPDLNGGV